ncbi:Uncharacterised protein [Neisseria animaloris]|nr:Uncharacterised protein [Neisseria animaloris]
MQTPHLRRISALSAARSFAYLYDMSALAVLLRLELHPHLRVLHKVSGRLKKFSDGLGCFLRRAWKRNGLWRTNLIFREAYRALVERKRFCKVPMWRRNRFHIVLSPCIENKRTGRIFIGYVQPPNKSFCVLFSQPCKGLGRP